MTAHRGIPHARLDVFVHGALLQIQLAGSIKDVQVYDGVQHEAAGVAIGPGGFANQVALFIDQREKFFHGFKSKKKVRNRRHRSQRFRTIGWDISRGLPTANG